MSATELVLGLLNWMWANPWSILLVLALIVALALWARRLLRSDYYYLSGKPRCYMCLDSTRTRHKVIYPTRQVAESEAARLSRKFGQQRPYKAQCGNWHLTSRSPHAVRQRRVKR